MNTRKKNDILLAIQGFLSSLRSLDKGLYFPIFIIFTCPFILYLFGCVVSFLYLFVISWCHSILLYFYPYIKDSEYYNYVVSKKKFFESRAKLKHPYTNFQLLIAKIFLLFSFYGLFFLPKFFFVLFPFSVWSAFICVSALTVDIINIVYRPRLPESIRWSHPILQRRYGPIADIAINKVLPLCVKTAVTLASSYVAFGGGYKALNGIDAIDPIRCFILNKYHGFPTNFVWDEPSLVIWRRFNMSTFAQDMPLNDRVIVFIEKKQEILNSFDNSLKSFINDQSLSKKKC